MSSSLYLIYKNYNNNTTNNLNIIINFYNSKKYIKLTTKIIIF